VTQNDTIPISRHSVTGLRQRRCAVVVEREKTRNSLPQKVHGALLIDTGSTGYPFTPTIDVPMFIVSSLRRFGFSLGLFLLGLEPSALADGTSVGKIVLIGGVKSHGPGEHDFPTGIKRLELLLKTCPDFAALKGLTVEAYPDGWPSSSALENALTVVWYFDGLEKHPLSDASRRVQFERIMDRGVGLVALHQSSTLTPTDAVIALPRWLGAARYGMVDRAMETVEFWPAAHPVSRGVKPFSIRDEFYPTLRFHGGLKKVTPILTAKFHRDLPVPEERRLCPVAWTWERPGGGRSFGFTGLHFVSNLEQPELRKLLLNAIVWTAGMEVPTAGVRSTDDSTLTETTPAKPGRKIVAEAIVSRPADYKVIEQPWGRLTWYVSGDLKNSDTMTVGLAEISPGKENPRHYHPNCDEVLHVLQGQILHTINDRTVEMSTGDTVSIPAGTKHNAKNIGTETAKLAISFSSADRQVIGE
jgi:quercetin dioxygenase-like cupin family protein/type 1 glutamine amidotransferase